MIDLPAIPLNDGWRCEYFEMGAGPRQTTDDEPVPSMLEWVFDKRRGENWAAWLKCGFDLEPTDACVIYTLHVDSAPEETLIYINGEKVGTISETPYSVDVTNMVALEYNEIALRVEWNAAGRFEGIRLQPVPCD
jgi:hypothetical protein